MTACVLYLAWVLAPVPAGDAHRLPPLAHLTSGRQFNSRYQDHLQRQLVWTPYERRSDLLDALAEARHLYAVWDSAEGAHPDWTCHPDTKADYLRRLRVLIGREAYRRADLPPCVPTWRFADLR